MEVYGTGSGFVHRAQQELYAPELAPKEAIVLNTKKYLERQARRKESSDDSSAEDVDTKGVSQRKVSMRKEVEYLVDEVYCVSSIEAAALLVGVEVPALKIALGSGAQVINEHTIRVTIAGVR